MLAAQDPHVDVHYPLHPRHAPHFSWLKAIARLRGEYDVVFALVFTHMSKAAVLARAIAPGAEYVVPRHGERALVYGQVFHRQLELSHWRQHWMQALLQMGQQTLVPSIPVEQQPQPYVPISVHAWERVFEQLYRWGLGTCAPRQFPVSAEGDISQRWQELPGRPYVVINLSAYTANRSWMPHHALLVCRELLERLPEVELLVIASPKHRRWAESLVDWLRHPRCRLFRGSLPEIIALLAGASWILTPDTAIVHIAAALGKPVVGLYSELIKVMEWYPFGVPFVLAVSPALEGISFMPPGAIVEAVEHLLHRVIPSGFVVPAVQSPRQRGPSAASTESG